MKFRFILWLAFASVFADLIAGDVALIPFPVSVECGEGKFVFGRITSVSLPQSRDDSVADVFRRMAPELEKAAGTQFEYTGTGASFSLRRDSSIPPEGYRLHVSAGSIEISASRPAGFFYALQTLRQLLPYDDVSAPAAVPGLEIADYPRFSWRGFMLDEGRHFFGKEEVKRVLDVMAAYKMNRFHWHLTDDQGWRIEIKSHPDLALKGGFRSSTNLGSGQIGTDTVGYGGYYTHEDIREIVDYAGRRFIEVIPEIDIPGHSQAAVAAYPEVLACDPGNAHEVWLMQGVSDDVINVANPAAVRMAEDIIDELISLFPSRYIHLGGDECPVDKWERNEACRMLLDSIGSDDFRDLQLNFYRELAAHIAGKPAGERRSLIFWNEVMHGDMSMLPDDVTVMAWVGAERAAREAAGRGLNTILSPQIPYYINRKQSSREDEPLSQGSGTETLKAVYDYVPMRDVPEELTDRYLGVQANFWSEYVATREFLEYLMLPRLAAVAEAAWTPAAGRHYDGFIRRASELRKMYEYSGLKYCGHELIPYRMEK